MSLACHTRRVGEAAPGSAAGWECILGDTLGPGPAARGGALLGVSPGLGFHAVTASKTF